MVPPEARARFTKAPRSGADSRELKTVEFAQEMPGSVSALVRGGRAIGQLLSVPLAGLLAFAALLALWCTSAVRRRERLALAVITYPRRGPPSLPPVE